MKATVMTISSKLIQKDGKKQKLCDVVLGNETGVRFILQNIASAEFAGIEAGDEGEFNFSFKKNTEVPAVK